VTLEPLRDFCGGHPSGSGWVQVDMEKQNKKTIGHIPPVSSWLDSSEPYQPYVPGHHLRLMYATSAQIVSHFGKEMF